MCRGEGEESEVGKQRERRKWVIGAMGMKTANKFGDSRVEKLKSSVISRSRMKLWMIRATTSVLLWTCLVQLTTLGETWGPRVLKGWPSCFSQDSASAMHLSALRDVPARVLPPKIPVLIQEVKENNTPYAKEELKTTAERIVS